MANYYVDLSLETNGHAGTTNDPYSLADWQAVQLGFLDTSFLKGTASIPGETITTSSNIEAWEPEINGPWRLECHTIIRQWQFDQYFLISGGILHVQNIQSYGLYLNCYIEIEGLQHLAASSCFFKESVLYMKGSGSAALVNPVFVNSVLVAPNQTWFAPEPSNVTWFSSAFSVITDLSTFPGLTFSNCQLDWSAPLMPEWNADRASFFVSSMFTGITIQPGILPYMSPVGLWGDTRTSIGTGSMLNPVEPPPVEPPPVEPEQKLPINPNKPGKNFAGVTLAGTGDVDLVLPKVTSFFRNINLPNMRRGRI